MDYEITEFDELNPAELHLVPAGANGFLPLLAKGALVDGSQTPDDANEDDDATKYETHIDRSRYKHQSVDTHARHGTTARTITKETPMNIDELIRLLDERDAAKKKAKAKKAASYAEVIKGLQAEIEALKNQPARPRPAINATGVQAGLRPADVATVRRGVAADGTAFKSLDDAVEKALASKSVKDLRAALRERGMAKIAANVRASTQLRPGSPIPVIGGSSEDARVNAIASLGHRSTGGRPIAHIL